CRIGYADGRRSGRLQMRGRDGMNLGGRRHETRAARGRASWTLLVCIAITAPARGDGPIQDEASAGPRLAVDAGPGRQPPAQKSLGPRSFRLGFTPDDLLDTPEVGETICGALSEHADLVAFHFGRGVPWEEALDERPFPPTVGRYVTKWSRLTGR